MIFHITGQNKLAEWFGYKANICIGILRPLICICNKVPMPAMCLCVFSVFQINAPF